MYKKVSIGVFVLVALLSFFNTQQASADVLVGEYNSSSTPSINGALTFFSSYRSGDYLYLNSTGGLFVINTQGTISQADDVVVATYDSASSPVLPSDVVGHSFLSGNLLYVTTRDGVTDVITVIDTQGTETQSDDTIVAAYSDTSSPPIPGGSAFHSFLSGNLLYVSTNGSGLVVINTQGTPTQSDDTAVATYSTTSTPSIPSDNIQHTFVSGNLIYISTSSSGLIVIDTQGTLAQGDDAIVALYDDTSSPSIGALTTYYSELIGNLLYVGTDGGGLSVIDTQGTSTQGDDILVANYNSSTTPAIPGGTVYHSFLSGNLLYVSTNGNGLVVINTQGTVTQTDDSIQTSYNTTSFIPLSANTVRHSFISGDLLYISADGGDSQATFAVVALTANSSDTITVSLPVNATISITSPADVTMGAITGTGQSTLTTNQAEWITKTNNAAGYELSIQASSADMTNANLDTVASYTPATPGTPEPWSIAATDSEWGMHYSFPQSTLGNDTVWGADDTYADNWVNVPTTPYVIETATAPTDIIGDSAVILFGAEVGSDKIQPTGNYTVDVTMTATTL